jgi:hypothetical protein
MSKFRDIVKYCEVCNEKLILNNNRDIIRKKFCSRKCVGFSTSSKLKEIPNFYINLTKFNNTPEVNKKKGHPGTSHPFWISDRSKVKAKRYFSEERNFFKEVMKERNYTCEISGEIGGKLSLHHLMGVSNNRDLIFDKKNVILIKKEIHLKFHKIYGTLNVNIEKWNNFIEKKEYL